MTAALGKALRLLAKHGLNEARKKDFPVEVAMESLLSSTTLAVAAAEDLGLKRSDHHSASLSPLFSYLWRPPCCLLPCYLAFPHLPLPLPISNIEYLLDRCVDADGAIASSFSELPVGRMLRGGITQHKLTTKDFSKLRSKTEKCIQVCMSVAENMCVAYVVYAR